MSWFATSKHAIMPSLENCSGIADRLCEELPDYYRSRLKSDAFDNYRFVDEKQAEAIRIFRSAIKRTRNKYCAEGKKKYQDVPQPWFPDDWVERLDHLEEAVAAAVSIMAGPTSDQRDGAYWHDIGFAVAEMIQFSLRQAGAKPTKPSRNSRVAKVTLKALERIGITTATLVAIEKSHASQSNRVAQAHRKQLPA